MHNKELVENLIGSRDKLFAVIDEAFTRITNECDQTCLLYTSPSPRDRQKSRMPSSA